LKENNIVLLARISAGSCQTGENSSPAFSFSVECMPEAELIDVNIGESVDLSG